MKAMKLLEWNRGQRQAATMVSLLGFGYLVYIAREAEATAELNQQTMRIILMCCQLRA
jgi:hypothetical protein